MTWIYIITLFNFNETLVLPCFLEVFYLFADFKS